MNNVNCCQYFIPAMLGNPEHGWFGASWINDKSYACNVSDTLMYDSACFVQLLLENQMNAYLCRIFMPHARSKSLPSCKAHWRSGKLQCPSTQAGIPISWF